MQKINVKYDVITGSQYNMVEMPSIRIKTPFAVSQRYIPSQTGLTRRITAQNKIIPETGKTTFAPVVIEPLKVEISPLVQKNPCLDTVRKRCDKKRTVAIDKARMAKQTRQTISFPETFEPELPDLDIINIFDLHANGLER